MIAQPDRFLDLSPDDYLAAEAQAEIKHEYHDGEVFAMAGVSEEHNLISGSLYTLLRAHLRGSSCKTFFADMKVRIESANRFYYPDLLVTCDLRDRETRYYKKHPKLIIEILSNSTEAFDRGAKFHHYRALESLQEYVLVNQDHTEVEIYRRMGDRTWSFETYGAGETVRFASLDLDCPIAEIYTDITF
jgi:Uma2 family endonuclease